MELDINNLSRYREDNRIEARRAKMAVPDSIWETYSSFANTDGGVILMGVDEKDDHSFEAVGVEDSHKIITDFWNVINNPQKISVNILPNRMVYPKIVDGKDIVVIEVPRAKRSVRPVYIGNNPLNGAFRRNGEGDYHYTKEKLNATVDYSISLEPERTTLKIEMLAETRDKSQEQGINKDVSRDKEAKQGIKADINSKSRDKILKIEGISEKSSSDTRKSSSDTNVAVIRSKLCVRHLNMQRLTIGYLKYYRMQMLELCYVSS